MPLVLCRFETALRLERRSAFKSGGDGRASEGDERTSTFGIGDNSNQSRRKFGVECALGIERKGLDFRWSDAARVDSLANRDLTVSVAMGGAFDLEIHELSANDHGGVRNCLVQ